MMNDYKIKLLPLSRIKTQKVGSKAQYIFLNDASSSFDEEVEAISG